MRGLLFCLALLVLLVTGCAKPPNTELAEARQQLAQAYAAGAKVYALDDYRQAEAVLQHAEELVASKRYTEAEDTLVFAASKARWAAVKAHRERAAHEAERQRHLQELAEMRQQEELAGPTPGKELIESTPILPQPTPKPKPKPYKHYTVGSGETLWTIAAHSRVYADPLLWPLIYRANRDQIKNPRQIYQGQVLSIPRQLSTSELTTARETARNSSIFPIPKDNISKTNP